MRSSLSWPKKPGTIFRFVGKRTAALENFLQRAQTIPGFKFEATGFVPYAEVARHLADASVGIVPYEESAGTHCAFVAKVVEYVASGLPSRLHAPQKHPELFPKRPDGAILGIQWRGFRQKNPRLA